MKFFTTFFSSIKHKSSINFGLNIFFIKHMLSINFNHVLTPHFFLPTKSLKIKLLKNNVNKFFYVSFFIFLFLSVFVVYLFI